MIQVVESDECARHGATLVWVNLDPPFVVCRECPGGKQFIGVAGTREAPDPATVVGRGLFAHVVP